MSEDYMALSSTAFSEAKEFEKASRILESNDEDLLLLPTVVTVAFACELYIKSILYSENVSFRRTHDLQKLYEILPIRIKNEINRECKMQIFEFDQFLENIKNAFETWRYVYEIDYILNISVMDSFRFAEILRKYREAL